jgi:hypothetical protein
MCQLSPIIPFPEGEDQFSHLYNPNLVNRYLERFSGIDRLLVGTDCVYMAQKYGRRIGIRELNAAVEIARVLDACVERGVDLAAKTLNMPGLCDTDVSQHLEHYISFPHSIGDSFVEGLRIALVGWGADDARFIASRCTPEKSRNMFYYRDCPETNSVGEELNSITALPKGKRFLRKKCEQQ